MNIWFCIIAIHERRWLCHYNRIIPGLCVAAAGIWFAIDFVSPWHQKKHCLLLLTTNVKESAKLLFGICSLFDHSLRALPCNLLNFLITMISSNGGLLRVTAPCAGNSPVTGEFPSQMPVTRSFDVFFDLHLNNRLGKQWKRRWFVMPSRLLWRHCNDDRVIC